MYIIDNIKKNRISENDYVKWIADQAIERSETQTCLNAYALTVLFKNRNSFQSENSISELRSINKCFRKLYLELCRYQFGDRYPRKQKFQARIHSFMDVAGTKYGNKSIENLGDNPHIHAVIIPHKSHAKTWSQNTYLDDVSSMFTSDSLVESVELKKIDSMDGLKKFIRYASKYYVHNASSQQYSDQLYCIYPDIIKS